MTDNKINLEQVTANDVDKLLILSRQTFFDFFEPLNKLADMEAYATISFTRQKLIDEINTEGSCFYFAMLKGEIAGYLKLNVGQAQTEFQDPYGLEAERIYVFNKYQGNKIGGQLLKFAIQTALDYNMQYIWLGVWEHNYNAIGFYEHHGFKVFSSHAFLLGEDLQNDLLMKKQLK